MERSSVLMGTGWIQRNIVNMTVLQKATYRFSSIPFKITNILHRKNKNILKFLWNHSRPQIFKAILSKAKKSGRITTSDSNVYYLSQGYRRYGEYLHQKKKKKKLESKGSIWFPLLYHAPSLKELGAGTETRQEPAGRS